MLSESKKKNKNIQILFIDDHPGLREGIADLLKNKNPSLSFFMAGSREEALAIFRTHNDMSLVILDLNLDGENGLLLIEDLRSIKENLPVLVYTMYSDMFHLRNALTSNIQGYISKDSSTDELYQAIMQVKGGGSFFNNAASKMLSILVNGIPARGFDSDEKAAQIFANYKDLTKSEQKIFEYLALKKDLTEIAKITGKSEKTIMNKRTVIYQKMELSDRLSLIESAQTLGIIE
ncbi:MAG: response regulator transcription factor [Treponema sp.]|nr:response regulator transcription factor [Treponema sp.]